jgi:hypothetical protein
MTDYRIDCVNKPHRNSPHEHITHVGGQNPNGVGRWEDTVPNVVRFIETNQHRFYTREGNASAWVGVRTSCWQQILADARRWDLEGQPSGT